MESNLQKAHRINRIIMRKLHEVCEKYGIVYYLDSGALLGAIRHKDFIPWDDDIDVAFTRDQFNKLLKVPKSEWGSAFEIVKCTQLVQGGFLDFVTRLIYVDEAIPLKTYDKAMKHMNPKYVDRIGIDLFIIDSIYENAFRRKLHTLRLKVIYGLAMGHRDNIDYSEYGLVDKARVFVLASIGKLMSIKKLVKKYDKVSRGCPKNSNMLYYSNYPVSWLSVATKKEWYASAVKVQSGEDYFYTMVGYDNVLKTVYGDYMQLPPEGSRHPDHVRED